MTLYILNLVNLLHEKFTEYSMKSINICSITYKDDGCIEHLSERLKGENYVSLYKLGLIYNRRASNDFNYATNAAPFSL